MPKRASFFELLTEAVRYFSENGYVSEIELQNWVKRLRASAEGSMKSDAQVEAEVRRSLMATFTRLSRFPSLKRVNPEVSVFAADRLRPAMRAEMKRRIMASARLIKLNKAQAVEESMRRFSGWATSVPRGGSRAVEKGEEKTAIHKPLMRMDFIARRCVIDQTHKLTSALNEIVALDGDAIAAIWHSPWRRPGYDYREDHKARDERVYAIRGNWALAQGLMKVGDAGYTDDITKPGEEVYCFPGESKIPFANGVRKAYRRWYSGDLTSIVTSSGKTLRGTPNHPVLTDHGWVALGSLQKGDNVIEVPEQLIQSLENDKDHPVSTIAEVFAALQESGITRSSRQSRADFHGDGTDGDVDIVFSDWPLTIGDNAASLSAKQTRRFPAEDLGDLWHRLPFGAQRAEVIDIESTSFAGHVYNLQTNDGWYVANGIVTHNCSCHYQYIYNITRLPPEMVTAKGRALMNRARAA